MQKILICLLLIMTFSLTGCNKNECCECKDCKNCDACCSCSHPYLNK